jgi:hypothetical protein
MMKFCLSTSDAADNERVRAQSNKCNAHDDADNDAGNSSIAQLALENNTPGFEMTHRMALSHT